MIGPMHAPHPPKVIRNWAIISAPLFLLAVCPGERLFAQAGLRESLERLDKNQNGEIDPNEITPLARPYLERIAKVRRLSLERSNEIDKLQEAARIYYALRNGVAGRDVSAEDDSTVREFGPDDDEPLIPEFGLGKVKYAYTKEDLEEADATLRRYDRNRDGFIDRTEAARAKWTHRNPFDEDFNKDDRLSRLELTQRYARRRQLSNDSDELRQKAWRTGSGIRPSRRDEGERREEWWRRDGSRYRLTYSVLGRFDSNRNGRLEATEVRDLGIPIGEIDNDLNGEVSREELHAFLVVLQDEASEQEEGLPSWFYELDSDRDGQVAMSEFTKEWTQEKLEEFAGLDANDDGFLAVSEIVQSKALVGGSYSNDVAQVLPPKMTVISEIEVSDDFVIADLNVQLSITHTNVSYLDAYLTGPDGQRIELFTEVGGSGDHFDRTIFDDQSRVPITKSRSPFNGSFMPEALLKRQPSLSHFNGKSIKGVWQLVIRGSRNQRFGMLHSWTLIAKPQEEEPGVRTEPQDAEK
jgi:Ca2+-binding EF-hand superfamily protein